MDPLLRCCLPPLPPQSRDAVPDEMAVDACAYNSDHFLLVGAYSTYHLKFGILLGVGTYSAVGADSVLYGTIL